ncbi:unnamed protein product [Musa acuminata var. zebrina]
MGHLRSKLLRPPQKASPPPWAPAVVPHLAVTRIKAERASLSSTKTPPPPPPSTHPSIPVSALRADVTATHPPRPSALWRCPATYQLQPFQRYVSVTGIPSHGLGPSWSSRTCQVKQGAKGFVVAAAMESVHEMEELEAQ